MLYRKSAVADRIPPNSEQMKLAREYDPFHLDDDEQEELRDLCSTRAKGIRRLERILMELHAMTQYDEEHKFQGTRNASETLEDGKGHCIEQGNLLKSTLDMYDYRTRIVIMKNPLTFQLEGIEKFALHHFLIFPYKNEQLLIDAVSGNIRPMETEGFSLTHLHLGFREYVAFFLHDAAEDLSKYHRKHGEALPLIMESLRIDPNNYTSYLLYGEILYKLGMHEAAERIILQTAKITPGLLDTFACLGDFYFEDRKDFETAEKYYTLALERHTNDVQIVYELEKRVRYMGLRDLEKKAIAIKERLLRTPNMRKYMEALN